MIRFPLLTAISLSLFVLPLSVVNAANTPCSGKKGGIVHCEGSRFVCQDGSYSASKKDCSVVFGNGTATPQTQPSATQTNLPVLSTAPSQDNVLKLDYEGFTVWLDCSKRGAVKFQYNAQHDTGSAKRYDQFFLDPKVPAQCQQTSSKAYGHSYDRGHLVPANHLDASPSAIKATNTMTNILPQTSQMNRGAWLLTEEIVECYRDIDELLVIGGVIWGNNPSDDYFTSSHGVKTPDAYWKVVIRGTGQDERAIAWIVPNKTDAIRSHLDNYLVTVDDIEKTTGEIIPVADYAKHDKPSQSWLIPQGCNKG